MVGADSVPKKLDNDYGCQGIKTINVALTSSWGGGTSRKTLQINIAYNTDGSVKSVSGSTSWTSDGSNSAKVSGYTVE